MEEEKIITKSITIDAVVSKVWETITNPEKMKLWLYDSDIEVISDWEIGSQIFFRGKFHGRKFEDKGIILKFEQEKVFQYSYFSWIPRLPDSPENYTIIEFQLTPQGGQTLLSLTQTGFAAKASYEHWNFYWIVTLGILKGVAEKG